MRFVLFFTLLVASCAAPLPLHTQQTSAQGLSPAQIQRVGQRIWQNECAGSVAGLTSWNTGENFASLGIGHFIWYPEGESGPFEESFPGLVQHLARAGVPLPPWLPQTRRCPWPDRASCQRAANSPQQQDLRALLSRTVREQTDYIIARLNHAAPRLVREGGQNAARSYQLLSQTPEGLFAMIDYINFKGDGLTASERYNGRGWGLAQVLAGMNAASPADAPAAFAQSSARVLTERVRNAPTARGEARWLQGWLSRCDAYRRPL
jgi:hypothetical protein